MRSASGRFRDVPSSSSIKDFCFSPQRSQLQCGMNPGRSQLGKGGMDIEERCLILPSFLCRFLRGAWQTSKEEVTQPSSGTVLCNPRQTTASSCLLPPPSFNKHSRGLPTDWKGSLLVELELVNSALVEANRKGGCLGLRPLLAWASYFTADSSSGEASASQS